MKKLLVVIGLVSVLALDAFAQAGQTYYYRYVESVDKSTGVRSKGLARGMYITFTKNSCYESDEQGRQARYPDGNLVFIYHYQGEKNNLYVYGYEVGMYQFKASGTYTFSKDYKRLNENYYHFALPNAQNDVNIYERADPPSKGPGEFY